MAIYSYKAPTGKTVRFEGPEGLTQSDIDLYGNNMFKPEVAPAPMPAPAPKGQSGFIPSIKRSAYQTSALLGDVLPAMVGKAVGAEDYAKRQMGEAAATLKKAEELYPAEVASYKDIKGVGDALTYVKEAIGEMVPSLLPSLFTGGAASLLARPAVAAATTAATEFATAEVARAAARNVLTKETLDGIRDAALQEGMKAAQKIALRSQAAGALAGSATQNIPEVFQNIYEETGKMEIGPALVAGGFNAVLDAIMPIQLLRKIDTVGIPREQIIAAWYKRAGKGALTGFATEGGTEAIQEMSSAAAEKFVDENKNFFTEKNFERFINSGLKGGFGGAAVTSATDVLTGKGPEKEKPPGEAPETETEAELPPPPEGEKKKLPKLERLRQDLAETEGKLAENLAKGRKGFPISQPQKKIERLKREIAEEEAKAAEGAPSVAGTVEGSTGTSFEILSPTDARLGAAQPQEPQPAGVAPATEPAGPPVGGAAAQPAPVTPPAAPAAPVETTAQKEARIRNMTDSQLDKIEIAGIMGVGDREEARLASAELERRKAAAVASLPKGSRKTYDAKSIADGEYVITSGVPGHPRLNVGRKVDAEELRALIKEFGDYFSFAPAPAANTFTSAQAAAPTPAEASVVAPTVKSLGDLAPEMQNSIMEMRDDLYEMTVDGTDAKKIARKLKALNDLETRLGVELTKPGTLGAKPTEIEQEEVESEAAIREARERKDRTIPAGYAAQNIPEDAEENYEAAAQERRAQAEAANAIRKKLVDEYEAAKEAHKAALAALQAVEDRLEGIAANDTAALDRYEQDENKASRREQDALDRLTEAAQALEAHGDEQFVLPPWYKLDADDKDVYFQYIRNSTPADQRAAEHRAAAQALIEYRQKLSKDMRGNKPTASEKRVIRNYEENRAFYTKLFGVQFPAWNRLSDAAKKIFTDEVSRERTTKGGKKIAPVLTGIQQDVAFAQVGVQILLENKNQSTAMALRVIEDQMKRREALMKETEDNRRELESLKRTFDRFKGRPGKGLALPQWLVKQINSNEDSTQAVLNYLRSADWLPTKDLEGRKIPQSATRRVYKALAQSLYAMKLKTKIKVVPDGSLTEERIAEYDPSNDTVYVTESNIDAPTLLHELVHAGTVKVLNLYVTGQHKLLTEAQIRAAEHLEDMMYEVAPTMAERFPPAFEVVGTNEDGTPQYSLMEFVAYGLTDEGMQGALHTFESKRAIITTNLPEKKSAWTKFKLLIAEILDTGKSYISFLPNSKVIKEQEWQEEYHAVNAFDKKEVNQSYLLEVAAAFEDILATPTEPIFISPLASVGAAAAPLTDEQIAAEALNQVNIKEHGVKSLAKLLASRRGYEWLVKQFQNERRVVKQISERAERFGMLQRVGAGINDVWGQLTRSTGMAVNLYDTHVRGLSETLDHSIEAYAKKRGISTTDALSRLHLIFEARHEPERRMVKYVLNVPLDNDTKNINLDGRLYSAQGLREEVLRRLSDNDLKGRTPQDYRAMIDQVISRGMFDKSKPENTPLFDPGNSRYNVIADRSPIEIAALKRVFDLPEDAVEIDAIERSLKELTDKTKALNRVANYWSEPVNNISDFYGFKKYVPFKGRKGRETSDPELDLGSRRLGGELQDAQNSFEGRLTESENPLLQIKADAATSALRAGRRELTLAIKNAVKQKILKGRILDPIDFKDRYLNTELKKDFGGEGTIFHYNDDGTIDVIKLEEKSQREAIRRTYRESSPILDVVNQITSGIGQTHTRYNPAFAPMNFVRDALTNAFTLGAEMGPKAAGRFLTTVAQDVASGGMNKAFKFAKYYADRNFREINRLARTDQYFADMLEYVVLGGRVSYLQGVAAKGALDGLMKEVGRSGVMRTKDQVDKFFDIYNDIFELSARASAFRTMKQQFLAKGEDSQTAAVHAAEYAKNLANFEQVGRWGKGAGALFMFFRPAATGAVRAIDALRPAFGFNEDQFRKEAKAEGRTDEQIDRAVKVMKEQKRNARAMSASLVGFGVGMYMMAAMLSEDDEEGRNKTATDDMARWTRYARFHIPGTDTIIQIPWGFGLGAFAAAGAQIAAAVGGNGSLKDTLSNVATIGLDSFLPLPFSRISPIDNFPAFMIDSATPSMARPFLEYVMNLDGLGREIYNNRQSRYGDAYTGGDNIPEMYKAAARGLFDVTNGAVDWSPNTLYFFASNFFDGAAKIASTGVNLGLTIAGEKDFNAKNDTLFLSSFLGTKSNVDAREFSKAEDYIKGVEKRIKSLEDKPEMLANFVENNPGQYELVKYYNHEVNGVLRKIRTAANQVRSDSTMSIKERKAQLDELVNMQNVVKRRLLEGFETLGYER